MIDTVRTVDAILEKAQIDRGEYRERFFWEKGDVRVSRVGNTAGQVKPERAKTPRKKR